MKSLHIVDLGYGGRQDSDIPALCASIAAQALVTMNVKDFGAKKVYLSALLDEGIHVAVVRPGRQRMDIPGQAGFIALALPKGLFGFMHGWGAVGRGGWLML